VNALSQALKITPAAVSQHLRVLRDAGLVTAEKRGYFVHYKANPAKMKEMNSAAGQLLEIKKGRKEQGFGYNLDNSMRPLLFKVEKWTV
jgi:DNA-binding transcriptional ArsR family regulator